MSDRATEQTLFELFLELRPEFAGESIREWYQPEHDPPDIMCVTSAAQTVGVELGEWLNQDQIAESKARKTIESSILAAIGKQPNNDLENIYNVWIGAKQLASVKPTDIEGFRSEIFELVASIDRRWPEEPDCSSPQGIRYNDFSSFPVIAKYLDTITCFPRVRYRGWRPNGHMEKRQFPADCDWLVFPGDGESYSERSSMESLLNIIAKKIAKYVAKPPQVHMDAFCLLIHYNQALLHNTPTETLFFKYEDAARIASEFIAGDAGAFQKIFLMLAFEPGQKVFQLYPSQIES